MQKFKRGSAIEKKINLNLPLVSLDLSAEAYGEDFRQSISASFSGSIESHPTESLLDTVHIGASSRIQQRRALYPKHTVRQSQCSA
jgi:hypothetical protein